MLSAPCVPFDAVSSTYVGRFAPSPTGALHAGSLVAALASWLDARAHAGQWWVRMEDVDTPRCVAGADDHILRQLAACGLHSDGPVMYQSQRRAAYAQAVATLLAQGWAYPCHCTRQRIAQVWADRGHVKARHGDWVYPGLCQPSHPHAMADDPNAAIRLNVQRVLSEQSLPTLTQWHDRRLGAQTQTVAQAVGDFVLRRRDGLWAYQLAVVVDDAAQGVTHVVRGQDLADNTARQIVLQQALGYARPRYLHTPLVLGPNREKLSKQNAATPLPLADLQTQPLPFLQAAAHCLGLPDAPAQVSLGPALSFWTQAWSSLYNHAP